MFKGLSPEIDAVKDFVFQAWAITSSTATSITRRSDPVWDDPAYACDVEPIPVLLKKMERALADLDKMIRDHGSRKGGIAVGDLGVLDADRTRWLLQFMRAESMF
ncbi:hypothetical protein RQP46_010521 [Phenoliferia psychrophenolica]